MLTFLFTLSLFACSFIQYCRDEGGYTGFTRAEEDVDVFARLQALYISIEPTGSKQRLITIIVPLSKNIWNWGQFFHKNLPHMNMLKFSTLNFAFLTSWDCRECHSAAAGPWVEEWHVSQRRAPKAVQRNSFQHHQTVLKEHFAISNVQNKRE